MRIKKQWTMILLGVALLVAAVIPRLWKLGAVPVAMSDDETRLVYSAYSIWKTGKDLIGHPFPLAFVLGGYAFNPVPIYLTSPFVGLLGLSMFTARLPFALAGIASVLLLFGIVKMFTGDRRLALLSALVLSVSVWHLQLSRFAYEGSIALLFYFLGTYCFLKVKKGAYGYLVLSLVGFVLAFYSYSGYKLTFVPVLGALAWYMRKSFTLRQGAVLLAAIVFAFGSLWYLGKTQGALTYGGTLFFFQDKAAVEMAVELERRASDMPDKLEKLYHNKLTYIWNVFVHKYEYAFSPEYLFSDQEGSGIFSLWGRGQMYYVDALLVFLGIFYLFAKYKKQLLLCIIFLLIAPLPSGLGPDPVNYTIRASFMLLPLAFFSGAGVLAIGYFLSNRFTRRIAYGTVAVVYLYFIGGYVTQYYYDWSRFGAKYYSKADRDLSLLLLQEKNMRPTIVVTRAAETTVLQFAFYADLPPGELQKVLGSGVKTFGNIVFTDTCLDAPFSDPRFPIPPHSLIAAPTICAENKKSNLKTMIPYKIISTLEGEHQWYLFTQ